jgi:hypothetical protein
MSIFDQVCSAVGSDFVNGQTVNQQYQPPQQRTWVGLSEENFAEACQMAERGNYLVAFKHIQTKLKEKNT